MMRCLFLILLITVYRPSKDGVQLPGMPRGQSRVVPGSREQPAAMIEPRRQAVKGGGVAEHAAQDLAVRVEHVRQADRVAVGKRTVDSV